MSMAVVAQAAYAAEAQLKHVVYVYVAEAQLKYVVYAYAAEAQLKYVVYAAQLEHAVCVAEAHPKDAVYSVEQLE